MKIQSKDNELVQTEDAQHSPRFVRPEDYRVNFKIHKREESEGKSKFTGRGAKVMRHK